MNHLQYTAMVAKMVPVFRRTWYQQSSQARHTAAGWESFVRAMYEQVSVALWQEYKIRLDVHDPMTQREIRDMALGISKMLNQSKTMGARKAASVMPRGTSRPIMAAARAVGGLLGPQWGAAPERRRATLIRAGSRNIDGLVDAYTKHLTSVRANFIGQNEVRAIFNETLLLHVIGGSVTNKYLWKSVLLDPGACAVCQPAGYYQIPLDQTFELSNGSHLAPPFHPHCRCFLILKD